MGRESSVPGFCRSRRNELFLILLASAENICYNLCRFTHGEVAQLVEHHVRNVGVESSNLFFSTILDQARPVSG